MNKNKTLKMPGALGGNQKHTHEIVSGSANMITELENERFQFKHAKELNDFLVANVPSGIYRKYVLLVLEQDVGCNNYIADKLNISRKEIRIKHNGTLHD